MSNIGQRFVGVLGLAVLVGIAVAFSRNRRRIPWRTVAWGLGLQFFFGMVFLAPSAAMLAALASLGVLAVVSAALVLRGRPSPWRAAGCGVAAMVLAFVGGEVLGRSPALGAGAPLAAVAVVALCLAAAVAVGFRMAWRRDPGWGVAWSLCAVGVAAATRTGWAIGLLDWFRAAFRTLIGFADEGSRFVLGDWRVPVSVTDAVTGKPHAVGLVLACNILPIIIFFACLMSVLYHLGVMQRVVGGMAWVMRRTMRVSGAEALAASGNIFVGMTEAPLMIRPYVAELTESELFAVMVGGLATIAGSVMALYVSFGIDAGHLLCASVMSAPASLAIAKIMLAESGEPKTSGAVPVRFERETRNVIDAAAHGASEGLRLALNVGAMLIAFVALLAMVNYLLGAAHDGLARLGWGGFPGSLQEILGWVFRPLAWVLGVPWRDTKAVGSVMGIGIAANECLGYMELVKLKASLAPRSVTIATYALCSFANFGSLGIIIGGISGMAPERRPDLSRLAIRALIGGALASYTTATIAGILL